MLCVSPGYQNNYIVLTFTSAFQWVRSLYTKRDINYKVRSAKYSKGHIFPKDLLNTLVPVVKLLFDNFQSIMITLLLY